MYEDVTSTSVTATSMSHGTGTIEVTSPNGKAPTSWSLISCDDAYLSIGFRGVESWTNVGNVYTGTFRVYNTAPTTIIGTMTFRIGF